MRAFVAAAIGIASSASAECPPDGDACEIDGGSYYAIAPDGEPRGALMFLHGWGSSGKGSLSMKGMVNAFTAKGYVVIAPNGTPREGRGGLRWSFHPDWPAARDEVSFLADVRDDAAARFGFDAGQVLLSGFSIGGSMASYVACQAPGSFAAYAPVGGGMWRPHPETCAGPVKLFHTHGWSDGTVPLEGRAVRGANARDPEAFVQGDVFATLDLWRETNGCVNHKPDRFDVGERYWRRGWDACSDGAVLDFALHPGGHAMPRGWSDMALNWFEAQRVSN